MKKKEQGILTIEASIVLTLFLLFVLFLFSFARMYRAQNMISHATMHSADALALESYIREVAHDEDANEIVKLGNQLSGLTSLSEESFTSLRAADIPKLAKEKFAVAISSSDASADAILKKLGVKGGLSGVDFSVSKIDLNTNDVIVYANYTLELQFPVFGFSEINVTKAARAKTFGDILFEISTISNDDRKGTASGGGSYKHGTTIEITAEPKYGYYFEGWDDDGDGDVDYDGGKAITASKRTVTVTDAKTYTAIFKNNGFGVNTSVNPAGIEEITIVPGPNAQGLHEYGSKVDVTVSHNNSHYIFSGWSGQLLQDKNGDEFEETVSPIPNPKNNLTYTIPEVQGNYHLTANFTPKQYNVSVSVKNGVGGTAVISGTNKSSTKVTYPNTVSLSATPAWGYAIDYWTKNGSKIQSSDGQSTINNEQITGDTNYVVVFKNIKVNVYFYGPDNRTVISTIQANKGLTFNQQILTVPRPSSNSGYLFSSWNDFDGTKTIDGEKHVYGSWKKIGITISGGSTEVNSTTLSASTTPNNVSVKWESSNNSVLSVSDGKVTAKKNGTATISAYFDYDGVRYYSNKKTITVKKSIKIEHFCRRDGDKVRHYYKTYPGPNNNDKGWAPAEYPGVWHREYWVTWSELKKTESDGRTVGNNKSGNAKTKSQTLFKNLEGTNKLYETQWGYNETGETGYVIDYGAYYGMFFVTEKHAPKDPKDLSKGYHDYYISAVK